MDGQDLREIANNMAVGTGLRVGLTPVGGRVDLDGMIDQTTGRPMVMTIEIGAMTGDALTAASNSRGYQATVSRVVAGAAAFGRMGLTGTDEGRGGCRVAAGTVGRGRGRGHVLLDLGAVVMGVGAKVGRMAGSAGAASAAVDRGIAMAVDTGDTGAVFRGMAVRAVVFVDNGDGIASVAADAERGRENRGRMAVGVAAEIGGVATGASASRDGTDVIPVDRISQGRGSGVAEAAVVLVHRHRIVGWVTGPDTGRGVSDMA